MAAGSTPSPVVLGDLDVHLWIADALDTVAIDASETTLSADERARAARFHFERDRRVYCASHLFLRQTLSRYAAVAPHDWQFVTGAWGRPEIAPSSAAEGLRFNLSHSGTMAACAVTRHRDVGVDLEEVKPDRATSALLARVLGPAELASMEGLAPAGRDRAFIERWTLKEAYLKATGRGFSIEPREVQFDLSSASDPQLTFASSINDAAGEWRFWRRHLSPTHIVSVAARCQNDALRLVEYR